MNCTQCGAIIRNHSGFCDQCGARVEEMLEQVKEIVDQKKDATENEDLGATTVINIKQELIQEAEEKFERQQALKESEAQRINILEKQIKVKRVDSERKKEIDYRGTSILNIIKLLVKNPLLSVENLELYIDDTEVVKSILTLVLASAIMTTISFNFAVDKLVSGLVALFGNYFLFMGSSYAGISGSAELVGDIIEMPFIQDSGFKIILYPILSHLILISLISLFIIGIFKVIKKEDIAWIDCIRLMLMPLSILLIGKIVVFLLSFISGTLAAYFYVLMMFAIVVITILQFINFLGKSTFIIYSMPLIYLISALIRNGIILQIIKISMARYALYF